MSKKVMIAVIIVVLGAIAGGITYSNHLKAQELAVMKEQKELLQKQEDVQKEIMENEKKDKEKWKKDREKFKNRVF